MAGCCWYAYALSCWEQLDLQSLYLLQDPSSSSLIPGPGVCLALHLRASAGYSLHQRQRQQEQRLQPLLVGFQFGIVRLETKDKKVRNQKTALANSSRPVFWGPQEGPGGCWSCVPAVPASLRCSLREIGAAVEKSPGGVRALFPEGEKEVTLWQVSSWVCGVARSGRSPRRALVRDLRGPDTLCVSLPGAWDRAAFGRAPQILAIPGAPWAKSRTSLTPRAHCPPLTPDTLVSDASSDTSTLLKNPPNCQMLFDYKDHKE